MGEKNERKNLNKGTEKHNAGVSIQGTTAFSVTRFFLHQMYQHVLGGHGFKTVAPIISIKFHTVKEHAVSETLLMCLGGVSCI